MKALDLDHFILEITVCPFLPTTTTPAQQNAEGQLKV